MTSANAPRPASGNQAKDQVEPQYAQRLLKRFRDAVRTTKLWDTAENEAGSTQAGTPTVTMQSGSGATPSDDSGAGRDARLRDVGLTRLIDGLTEEGWGILEDLVQRCEVVARPPRMAPESRGDIDRSVRRLLEEARVLESWRISLEFYRAIDALRAAGVELRDIVVQDAASELAAKLNEKVFRGSEIAFAERSTVGTPLEERHDFEPRSAGVYRPIGFRFESEVRKIKAMLVPESSESMSSRVEK